MSRRIVSSGTSPRSAAHCSWVRWSARQGPLQHAGTKIRNVESQKRDDVVLGVLRKGALRVAQRALQDDDDGVALPSSAPPPRAPNQRQWSPMGSVGRPRRPPAADAARLRDALDEAPRLGLGEGQAGGAMAQARASPTSRS